MNVAAIDIGTNTMRLLIVDRSGMEIHRQVIVTSLGMGVDATGRFAADRVSETLDVMEGFGRLMRRSQVASAAAVATSASRDAENGAEFIEAAAGRLGFAPEVIDGDREASLAYAGATEGREVGRSLVIDIGGGSTEFTLGREAPTEITSIDMGSVRLTDRCLGSRPAGSDALANAVDVVAAAFASVPQGDEADVIGVGGTFTSLAAISLGLDVYERSKVDGALLTLRMVDATIERLAGMSIAETSRIPSLDPKRAPVILAGAVVASGAFRAVGADELTVSESDLLDALAAELLRR